MGSSYDKGKFAFRLWDTPDVPATTAHKVDKKDVWDFALDVDDRLGDLEDSQASGSILKTTYALLAADLAHDADSIAQVYPDVQKATASRARSSNVATIVMGSSHGYTTGLVVNVSELGGTGYNLNGVTITVTNATTFTYASTGGNEGTTSDTNGLVDQRGIYLKSGATGVGSWVYNRPLTEAEFDARLDALEADNTALKPLAVIDLIVSGTANAIVATSNPSSLVTAVNDLQLLRLRPTAANTNATVTLQYGGVTQVIREEDGTVLALARLNTQEEFLLRHDVVAGYFKIVEPKYGNKTHRCYGNGGTATAITASTLPLMFNYDPNHIYELIPTADASGSTTINLNGLGAKTVKEQDGTTNVAAGRWKAQEPIRFRAADDLSSLLLLSPSIRVSTIDTRVTTIEGLYVKKDGSVAFTADQSMGSHKLTNVTNPTSAQDAATKTYVDSADTSEATTRAAADTALSNRTTTLETNTAPFTSGGIVGGVPTKRSSTGADVTWSTRRGLEDTPVEVFDPTNASTYQVLTSNGVTPGTAVTVTNGGGDLILTSNVTGPWYLGVGLGYVNTGGRTISFKAKFTTIVGTNPALVIGFTTTAPTLGGAAALLATNFIGMYVRADGAIVFTTRDASSTPGSPPVIASIVGGASQGGASCSNFNLNDIMEIDISMDESGTAAELQIVSNNRFNIGAKLTNLPSSANTFVGMRTTASSGDVMHIQRVASSTKPFTAKTIYINSAVSDGATGTSPTNAFSVSDSIVDIIRDQHRRRIKVILKNGSSFRGQLRFNGSRYDEITVQSLNGQGATILGSRFIIANPGTWTNITSTNVWYLNNTTYDGISNPHCAAGGLIDLSHSQSCGLTGSVTLPFRVYGRMAPVAPADLTAENAAIALLNLSGNAGCIQKWGVGGVGTTATYAGKVLVHCIGDVDPNGINWELSQHDSCIHVDNPDSTAWPATRLNIEGVQCFYGYAANIYAERCHVDITSTKFSGCSALYGMELAQCYGVVADCIGQGNSADTFHNSGALLDATTPTFEPVLRFLRCFSEGNPSLPNALTVGDGWSNEVGGFFHLIDCRARAASKDGLSAVDNFTATNFRAEDCVSNGIAFTSQSGKTQLGKIFGGHFKGNDIGVKVGNSSGSATVDIYRAIFDTNVSSSLNVSGSATSAANAYDCKTTGAAPSGGHKVTSGSGTITTPTLSAL